MFAISIGDETNLKLSLIEKSNEFAPLKVFAELCNLIISLKLLALAGSWLNP